MNTSTAFAQWTGSGYVGIFSPSWTSAQEKVTDARGEVLVLSDRWQAETLAWRALRDAEEGRYRALRFDPAQIKPSPDKWASCRPTSKAGRIIIAKKEAESVFRSAGQ